MLSEFLTSAQSNALIQYAIFFLLIIGLFLVIVSAALINEQNENETINGYLIETVSSRVGRDSPGENHASPLPHDSLLWKIGLMNTGLNMSVLAALYSSDENLKPWVSESICWRLLFCFGVTLASTYEGRMMISHRIPR
jgi:hypothetical protein